MDHTKVGEISDGYCYCYCSSEWLYIMARECCDLVGSVTMFLARSCLCSYVKMMLMLQQSRDVESIDIEHLFAEPVFHILCLDIYVDTSYKQITAVLRTYSCQ